MLLGFFPFILVWGFFLCLLALFVFKKERVFRLPLSGCGMSISCWGLVGWSFLEDAQGGHVIQPDDQSLCFESCQAAQHFPKVTPSVGLFCCSKQPSFPFAQRRHFWVVRLLCAVCKVLASIRTTTQGHCALGMILSLGSFLVVVLVMTCVFWHAPS